jgi:hypothetical protein
MALPLREISNKAIEMGMEFGYLKMENSNIKDTFSWIESMVMGFMIGGMELSTEEIIYKMYD